MFFLTKEHSSLYILVLFPAGKIPKKAIYGGVTFNIWYS